jgi:hypothetical protein
MRHAYLALSMVFFCSVLKAQPIVTLAAPPPSGQIVYLDDAMALAELKAANPDHYARARAIMAAANHLCRGGPPGVYFARYHARDVSCSRLQLYTSLPPKRRLSFRLDDTLYVALVVITDNPAHGEPVRKSDQDDPAGEQTGSVRAGAH